MTDDIAIYRASGDLYGSPAPSRRHFYELHNKSKKSSHRADPPSHKMDPSSNTMDSSSNRLDPASYRIDPISHRMDPSSHGIDPRSDKSSSHRKDKKWSLSNIFRRKKKEEEGSSSSEGQEEKKGFLGLRRRKKRKVRVKTLGTFDHVVFPRQCGSYNSYEENGVLSDPTVGSYSYMRRPLPKTPSQNPQSLQNGNNNFDSMHLGSMNNFVRKAENKTTKTLGTPTRDPSDLGSMDNCTPQSFHSDSINNLGSMDTFDWKTKNKLTKARAEARRSSANPSSSEEESNSSLRIRSEENLRLRMESLRVRDASADNLRVPGDNLRMRESVEESLRMRDGSKRSRAARTERYFKRLSKSDAESNSWNENRSPSRSPLPQMNNGNLDYNSKRENLDYNSIKGRKMMDSSSFRHLRVDDSATYVNFPTSQNNKSFSGLSTIPPSHTNHNHTRFRVTNSTSNPSYKPPQSMNEYNHSTKKLETLQNDQRSVSYDADIHQVMHVQFPVIRAPRNLTQPDPTLTVESATKPRHPPPPPPPRDLSRLHNLNLDRPATFYLDKSRSFSNPTYSSIPQPRRTGSSKPGLTGLRSSSEDYLPRPSSACSDPSRYRNRENGYLTDRNPRSRKPIQVQNDEKASDFWKRIDMQTKSPKSPNHQLDHQPKQIFTSHTSIQNKIFVPIVQAGDDGNNFLNGKDHPDHPNNSGYPITVSSDNSDQLNYKSYSPKVQVRSGKENLDRPITPGLRVIQSRLDNSDQSNQSRSPSKSNKSDNNFSSNSDHLDHPITSRLDGLDHFNQSNSPNVQVKTNKSNGDFLSDKDHRNHLDHPITSRSNLLNTTRSPNVESKDDHHADHHDRDVIKRKSANLEEALDELEAIYNSLRLGDEDLLERAEQREKEQLQLSNRLAHPNYSARANLSYSLSDSSLRYEPFQCACAEDPRRMRDCDCACADDSRRMRRRNRTMVDLKHDDMAFRKLNKGRAHTINDAHAHNALAHRISYLDASPVHGKKLGYAQDAHAQEPNEPDITQDDVVYRNIKDANTRLKVLDPQPPFGIPLGPIAPAPNSDYLHADHQNFLDYRPKFKHKKIPDVVRDDLAFRNLRKDDNKGPALLPTISSEDYKNNNLDPKNLDYILDKTVDYKNWDPTMLDPKNLDPRNLDCKNLANLKKKRAQRSLSANIGSLIHQEVIERAKLKSDPKSSNNNLGSKTLTDIADAMEIARQVLREKEERIMESKRAFMSDTETPSPSWTLRAELPPPNWTPRAKSPSPPSSTLRAKSPSSLSLGVKSPSSSSWTPRTELPSPNRTISAKSPSSPSSTLRAKSPSSPISTLRTKSPSPCDNDMPLIKHSKDERGRLTFLNNLRAKSPLQSYKSPSPQSSIPRAISPSSPSSTKVRTKPPIGQSPKESPKRISSSSSSLDDIIHALDREAEITTKLITNEINLLTNGDKCQKMKPITKDEIDEEGSSGGMKPITKDKLLSKSVTKEIKSIAKDETDESSSVGVKPISKDGTGEETPPISITTEIKPITKDKNDQKPLSKSITNEIRRIAKDKPDEKSPTKSITKRIKPMAKNQTGERPSSNGIKLITKDRTGEKPTTNEIKPITKRKIDEHLPPESITNEINPITKTDDPPAMVKLCENLLNCVVDSTNLIISTTSPKNQEVVEIMEDRKIEENCANVIVERDEDGACASDHDYENLHSDSELDHYDQCRSPFEERRRELISTFQSLKKNMEEIEMPVDRLKSTKFCDGSPKSEKDVEESGKRISTFQSLDGTMEEIDLPADRSKRTKFGDRSPNFMDNVEGKSSQELKSKSDRSKRPTSNEPNNSKDADGLKRSNEKSFHDPRHEIKKSFNPVKHSVEETDRLKRPKEKSFHDPKHKAKQNFNPVNDSGLKPPAEKSFHDPRRKVKETHRLKRPTKKSLNPVNNLEQHADGLTHRDEKSFHDSTERLRKNCRDETFDDSPDRLKHPEDAHSFHDQRQNSKVETFHDSTMDEFQPNFHDDDDDEFRSTFHDDGEFQSTFHDEPSITGEGRAGDEFVVVVACACAVNANQLDSRKSPNTQSGSANLPVCELAPNGANIVVELERIESNFSGCKSANGAKNLNSPSKSANLSVCELAASSAINLESPSSSVNFPVCKLAIRANNVDASSNSANFPTCELAASSVKNVGELERLESNFPISKFANGVNNPDSPVSKLALTSELAPVYKLKSKANYPISELAPGANDFVSPSSGADSQISEMAPGCASSLDSLKSPRLVMATRDRLPRSTRLVLEASKRWRGDTAKMALACSYGVACAHQMASLDLFAVLGVLFAVISFIAALFL